MGQIAAHFALETRMLYPLAEYALELIGIIGLVLYIGKRLDSDQP